MKKHVIIMFLVGIALSFTQISAQNLNSLKEKVTAKAQTTSATAKAKAEQMAKDLKLTTDQKNKIETVFTNQESSIAKLKTEAKEGTATYKTKLTAITTSSNTEIEKIIGKEKMQQYQTKLNAEKDKLKSGLESKIK